VAFVIITTNEGDRWDLISYRAYGDPFLYERIIAANPHIPIHPTLPAGVQVWCPVIAASPAEAPPWKR
jgi:phage tail protein X